MTDEQINAAIAEACGWVDCRVVQKATLGSCKPVAYGRPNEYGCDFVWPSFATDLNAMHEAEKWMISSLRLLDFWKFAEQLKRIVPANLGDDSYIHATARQRAEAFLRTLGKWEEGE